MGFRSTFTSEDYRHQLPWWFIKKYSPYFNFSGDERLCIHTKREVKRYSQDLLTFEEDLRLVLNEMKVTLPFHGVWLHECGGVTLVEWREDQVIYMTPTKWEQAEETGGHYHCTGCSSAKTVLGI